MVPIPLYLPSINTIFIIKLLLIILPLRLLLHEVGAQMVIIIVRNNRPGSSVVRVMPRAHGPSQDVANEQEKIDRGVLEEVEDALDEVAILAEDLEGKSLAVAAAESSEMIVAAIFRGHNSKLKGMIVRAQE